MPINKICVECGNIFRVSPSRDRIKFCSQKCYWDNMKGKPSGRIGFKHSSETIEKIRKTKQESPVSLNSINAISGWWKGKKRESRNTEYRLKLSLANEGKHRSPRTEIEKGLIPWNKGLTVENDPRMARLAKKCSITKKLLGQAPSREARIKGFKVARGIKPTRPEKAFIDFCNNYTLPFKYTGKGDIWIGRRNPDFIDVNGRNTVVEIFGKYWHIPEDAETRKIEYNHHGFDCITFFEAELKDPSFVIGELQKHGYYPNTPNTLDVQVIRTRTA